MISSLLWYSRIIRIDYYIRLVRNAFPEQIAFQKALHEYVSSLDTKYATEHDEFFISFEGSFGTRHVTPRTLTSRFLGNMVCLEGIITKCMCHMMTSPCHDKSSSQQILKFVSMNFSGSMVFPKIVKSVHYCPATGKTTERRYTDLTSFDAFPSSSVYPTKVSCLVVHDHMTTFMKGVVVLPVFNSYL